MKKYLSLFMLVGLLFSPFAYAEEGKGTGGLERMPPVFNPDLKPKLTEEQKAKRDAFLEEIKARKESWREANKERKAAFCEQAGKVFGQRFGSSIGAIT